MSPENPFCIRGYKTFCPKLLDTQKYTRVLCLVSEKLDCTLKDEFMDPGISSVWVQLQQSDKGEKTLIGCLYREFKVPAAPGTAATAIQERNKAAQTQRMQIFGSQLSRATAQFKNVFVCGDVNLDLSKIEISTYYNPLRNLTSHVLSADVDCLISSTKPFTLSWAISLLSMKLGLLAAIGVSLQ